MLLFTEAATRLPASRRGTPLAHFMPAPLAAPCTALAPSARWRLADTALMPSKPALHSFLPSILVHT